MAEALLSELINEFKNNRSQELYNNILIKVLGNPDKSLMVITKLEENNKETLKATFKELRDDDNNSYIICYTTDYKEIDDEGGNIVVLNIKSILDTLMTTCAEGIVINPDKAIDSNNKYNQCVIPKEYILKIIDMLKE